MKILSVTTSLLGDDAASWRIWNIARLLQERGHKVHLVQYVRKADIEKLNDNILDLGRISRSVIIIPAFLPISIPIAQMKHLIELFKDGYDLVYGNQSFGAFYSIFGKQLKRVPLIFDMHGGLVEEFLLVNQSNPNWKLSVRLLCAFLLDNVIEFSALRFSSKIACVSRKMIQYLNEEKEIPIEKMSYIPNGVNLRFFKPVKNDQVRIIKNQLGLGDKFIFGYIGGFDKWQGVENLIEVAVKIKNPRIAFLIVGGKKRSNENNIIFIPKVPRSEIIWYYAVCDVLVLPRPSHPATEIAAPTKFAEYTAMGKPLLVTNVGDAAELVKKYSCGIVVGSNEPDDLLLGIMEFTSKSKEELSKMGENSRRLAETEFDWDKIGTKLVSMVEEVIKTS